MAWATWRLEGSASCVDSKGEQACDQGRRNWWAITVPVRLWCRPWAPPGIPVVLELEAFPRGAVHPRDILPRKSPGCSRPLRHQMSRCIPVADEPEGLASIAGERTSRGATGEHDRRRRSQGDMLCRSRCQMGRAACKRSSPLLRRGVTGSRAGLVPRERRPDRLRVSTPALSLSIRRALDALRREGGCPLPGDVAVVSRARASGHPASRSRVVGKADFARSAEFRLYTRRATNHLDFERPR